MGKGPGLYTDIGKKARGPFFIFYFSKWIFLSLFFSMIINLFLVIFLFFDICCGIFFFCRVCEL